MAGHQKAIIILRNISWPSLQQLSLSRLQSGDAARLLTSVFNKSPQLRLDKVTLTLCLFPEASQLCRSHQGPVPTAGSHPRQAGVHAHVCLCRGAAARR